MNYNIVLTLQNGKRIEIEKVKCIKIKSSKDGLFSEQTEDFDIFIYPDFYYVFSSLGMGGIGGSVSIKGSEILYMEVIEVLPF